MSGAQHTPGWTADRLTNRQGIVRDERGHRVAVTDTEDSAKLIAARVNAHDGLVEALTDLLHNSAPPHSGEAAMDVDFERRYKAAADNALAKLAAIAKATGSAP